jgi:hypothetical protein
VTWALSANASISSFRNILSKYTFVATTQGNFYQVLNFIGWILPPRNCPLEQLPIHTSFIIYTSSLNYNSTCKEKLECCIQDSRVRSLIKCAMNLWRMWYMVRLEHLSFCKIHLRTEILVIF